MKKILLVLLLVAIATSADVALLCDGYSNAQACFHDEDITTSPSMITGCKTYANPEKCSEVYPGYVLSTDGSSTSLDYENYPGFVGLDHSTTETNDTELQFLETFEVKFDAATNKDSLSWTSMACVVDRQVIVVCKAGYFYDATTYKCAACGAGCQTCTSNTECTKCGESYFLSSGTCTQCDIKAKTCESATKASKCEAHYYLKDDGSCGECPTGALCSEADKINSCMTSYYLTDGETPECKTCVTNNALQCTAEPTTTSSTGIDECQPYDGTNYYYLYSTAGCKAHPKSNKCLTITVDSDNVATCASCWEGYVLSEGVCKLCIGSSFVESGETASDAISSCTAGTVSTAAVPTCKDGYYLEKAEVTNKGKCVKCENPCSKCNKATADDDLVCTEWEGECASDEGLQTNFTDDSSNSWSTPATTDKKECNTSPAGCKTLNKNENGDYQCTECFSTYALKQVYESDTSGEFSTELNSSCVLISGVSDSADHYGCLTYEYNGANETNCLSCQDGFALQTLYEDDTADTFTAANIGLKRCTPYLTQWNKYKYAYQYAAEFQINSATSPSYLITQCAEDQATGTQGDYVADTSFDAVANDAVRCFEVETDSTEPLYKCTAFSYDLDADKYHCTDCDTGYALKIEGTISTTTWTLDHQGRCITPVTTGAGAYCTSYYYADASTFNCLKCQDNYALQKFATYNAVDGTTDGYFDAETNEHTCVAVSTDADNDDFAYCTEYYNSSDTNYGCTKCKDGYALEKAGLYNAVDGTTSAFWDTHVAKDTCVAVSTDPDTDDFAYCTEYKNSSDTNYHCTKCKDGYALVKGATHTDVSGSTPGSWGTLIAKDTCVAVSIDATNDDFAYCTEYYNDSDTDYSCTKCKDNYALVKYGTVNTDSTIAAWTLTALDKCTSIVNHCTEFQYDNTTDASNPVQDCLACDDNYALKTTYDGYNSTTGFSAEDSINLGTCESIETDEDEGAYQCTAYNYYSNGTDTYVQCTSCADGYILKKIYGDESSNTFTAGKELESRCIAEPTDTTKYADKYNCQEYKQNGASPNSIECTKCQDPHYYSSGKCYTVDIANCKMSKTDSATTGVSATGKCYECESGYIIKDQTSCLSCSAVESNCAKDANEQYKVLAGATACECSECEAGYYLDENKACKNDLLTGCALNSPTMTTDKDCAICKVGYKWNSETLVCDACSDTVICATSGCSSNAYPGKASSSSSGSNSTIMTFVLSALLALITLLI